MQSRRDFLASSAAAIVGTSCSRALLSQNARRRSEQRIIVIMFDGFGLDYLEQSDMPTLKRWQREGLYKQVKDVMPSVTNANNASICCGTSPNDHGITGNSYFDAASGHEEYMEDGNLLLAPTLFERAAKYGVSSALLSSKKKTISLLSRGTTISLTAEAPSQEWIDRLGPAPSIYSREINFWTFRAAIDILEHRSEIGCIYLHTTDYPMHTWAPDAPESKDHLKRIDSLLAEAHEAAPDAAILLTADHGMNRKTHAYDLDKALAAAGVPIRISISAERDRYVKHHMGLGGTAWLYLKKAGDQKNVANALRSFKGIESVLTREEAVNKWGLYGSRIGDLCVFGDRNTVFGQMEESHSELPINYRSHGSAYESDIPLLLFNASEAPAEAFFTHNFDLTSWLFRT
jgi:phosphonoacetate hydrolase